MKTTMKHLAAGTFIALLLMVGNVKAEGTDLKATSQAIETTLQVEKWMTDETIWNKKTFTNESAQETETTLDLEDWMTSEETWNVNNTENEPELAVESWMTNNNIWNR